MTGRPGTERADPIAGDVRAVRRDGRERYGARKIKAALERKGVTASRRRIGSIMREQVDWLQCIRQSDEGRMT